MLHLHEKMCKNTYKRCFLSFLGPVGHHLNHVPQMHIGKPNLTLRIYKVEGENLFMGSGTKPMKLNK